VDGGKVHPAQRRREGPHVWREAPLISMGYPGQAAGIGPC
jgi:hypothetical protein